MKKSYLAAAAILGVSVLAGQAHAVKIKLGDGKSFKMGFRAKIHATYKGKRDANDKSDLVLSIPGSRIYGKGSISKIFKWVFQGDFRSATGSFRMVDTFIMLDFAKEFKIYAGGIKIPFELHSGIQSGWSFVMPAKPAYGLAYNPFTNPDRNRLAGSGSRSPQLGVWGKVAGGMVKYYLYLTDGSDQTANDDSGTGFGARVEFAPTMAGFKGHPGFVLKETYLGKQNTLSIGLSYYTRRQDSTPGSTATSGETSTSFGIDAMWEQNLGAITPNVSVGYVDHKNFRGKRNDDRTGLIIQGQVLFNQKTILGKPAVGVRWAQSDPENRKKSRVFGVVAQLYVKGVGNRIALSIENVKDDNRTPPKKDSYTDVTLAFWYNF